MRRIGILFALTLLTIGMGAQQLTEQEAMERALQYLNGTAAMARSKAKGSGMRMTAAKVGAERIYAFNREGGGYVIASADSRTLPVLGYADSGSIDWEQMPDNMRAWLRQYDEAIATLGNRTDFKDGNRLGNGQALGRRRTARAAVEPFIKTHWDQVPPFNSQAPLYGGKNPNWQGLQCVVGCMPVALAQVLNYWQWPKSLPDGLPAYESVDYFYDYNSSWQVDALPPVTFDWEHMLNDYPDETDDISSESVQAVSTLMRYCGQALKAYYSPGGAYTYNHNIRQAIVDHFGFAAAIYIPDRELFGIDEWEEMVYQELAAGRPVIYGGGSPTYGPHSFVCDGYNSDGLFHINWGWQGDGDGYYALSVLNPFASTDPNTGSDQLGYTQQQDMIIGIDPHLKELDNPLSDFPEFWQNTKMTVEDDNTILFQFVYLSKDSWTIADYALGTIESDGTLTPRFFGDPADSLISTGNNMYVEIDSTVFQPGETLRLHPMLRVRHASEPSWQIIPPDSIFVDAGRTADGRFFIDIESYKLECVGGSITSGRDRIGANCDLTVTIRSHEPADHAVTFWLVPTYYGYVDEADVTDETPSAIGDRIESCVILRAGEEGEATFLFTPEQGGLVKFDLTTNKVSTIDSFTMKFGNIFESYNDYLVNNSYVTHEGNHYVYHVELCDRPGVAVPAGVPSDNIYLYASIGSTSNDASNSISLRDELKDYLRALPDSAGSGHYKFTAELPLDIEHDGQYYARSYLNEWLDEMHTENIFGALKNKYFTVSVEPTTIQATEHSRPTIDHSVYDLQGRKVVTAQPDSQWPMPNSQLKKGIYIHQGRKTIKQ